MSNITLALTRARRSGVNGEIVALGGFITAVLAVTSLPYAFGYLSAPPEKQFMGILLNVPDNAQYLSWARESSRQLLIENKLTPEAGDAVFFNLFWLLVGRLAVATGLGYAESLQLVRPLAGALYLWGLYWFAGLYLAKPLHRWTCFLVVSIGGGLGWVLVLAKQVTGQLSFPLDLYVTEANAFLTVMAFPQQAMAGALLVLILGFTSLAFEGHRPVVALEAGVLALALGLQHGYDLLIVYGVVVCLVLVLSLREGNWARNLGLGLLICGPSAPAALYLAYLTRESPIWKGVLAQYGNAGVYTPDPAHLLILLGAPLILLLVGRPIPIDLRSATPRELLLGIWLVLGYLLLYIPTDFQVKMLACWQVPVGLLATRLLFSLLPFSGNRFGSIRHFRLDLAVAALFVALVLPTNVYLFAWRFVDLARHDYPYYLHSDEVGALRWLEANAAPSDVVLSSLTIGQYVPAISGNRAFLAHWAQTLDFYGKREGVTGFFDKPTAWTARLELVQRFNVGYLVHGEQERSLGSYDPGNDPMFVSVYSRRGTSVYRVQTVVGSRLDETD